MYSMYIPLSGLTKALQKRRSKKWRTTRHWNGVGLAIGSPVVVGWWLFYRNATRLFSSVLLPPIACLDHLNIRELLVSCTSHGSCRE